jgi:hypothetical protein
MGFRDSGSQIQQTQVWDLNDIEDSELNGPLKELFIRLYQNLNGMAMAINGKDTGIYHTDEFVTGKVYPSDPTLTSASTTTPIQRPVYRKVIDFGALPNAGTKTIAHGLTVNSGTTWIQVTGCATDPVGLVGVNIPYSSDTANDSIELWVDNTNVNITTASDWSAYTRCYILVEWLKF